MKICRSFAMIAALSLLATGAFAQNALVDGDFESGTLDAWVTYGVGANSTITLEPVNGPGAAGTTSVLLDNQAPALGLGIKQSTLVGMAGAGTVDYAFDLKLDQADVGGVLFVQIFAEQSGVGIIGGSGLMGPFFAWDWTTYSGSFEAPEGTDFLTIQFTATTGAAEGSNCIARVDNVVLNQPGIVANETTTLEAVKAQYR